MSDDLTVMGIAAAAAAALGREQIVLAHQAEHPLAGNPDVATDPKPSPDLAVALALPGRCLQVGFDRHQQRLVRDRGLRSPTLCRRLLGVLAGGHGVERGAGHAPGSSLPRGARRRARRGRGRGPGEPGAGARSQAPGRTAQHRSSACPPAADRGVIEPESTLCPCGCGEMRSHRRRSHRAARHRSRAASGDRHRAAEVACRACEEGVTQAPAPARLIEGALPTEGLLQSACPGVEVRGPPPAVSPVADPRPLGHRSAPFDPCRLGRQGVVPTSGPWSTAWRRN